MFKFNHESFKTALKSTEKENHEFLMKEIDKVKAFVEKGLTMFLESNTNMARTECPGLEI